MMQSQPLEEEYLKDQVSPQGERNPWPQQSNQEEP